MPYNLLKTTLGAMVVAMCAIAAAEAPYLGGDAQLTEFGETSKVEGKTAQIRLGTMIHRNFGGEVHLGKSIENAELSTTNEIGINYGFSAFAKPTLPLSEQLAVYALLGGSYINLVDENNLTASGSSVAAGAGLSIQISPSFSIAADYVQYQSDISGVNVGLRYHLK